MIQVLKWLGCRARCAVRGHKFSPGRFYHPASKSMQSGYICDRCGHAQLLLWRWQSVEEDSA